ncbi:MAG TPA: 30S ribosomal protein S12 methylthiotransferase RimO [Clostridia bacterium]|nr:30S ribosomal protein S12 methylthiotransferase RimO [Clostridia bacterium]
MNIKVGLISLGCPKNQVDAETMLAGLSSAGFGITKDAGLADVVIINTCGFIEDAKKESIENILEMAQLKKEGTIKGIVVTGCLAERYYKEMQQEFPEVNCILTVGRAGDIEQAVRAAFDGGSLFLDGKPEQLELGGKRVVTTLPFFAYLKIAEGCDNCCSYCVIPKLRGRFRSRPMEDILDEARRLVGGGVRELTLVAQDTTRYGEDLYGRMMLPGLLRELCKIEKLEWIRLLYCYPDKVTDELIDTIADEPKIAKYIDLPIQHVSTRIVRQMNRRDDRAKLETLIGRLREKIPGLTLRTTLIVGFPGETQEEFAELIEFVKQIRFERLGAFAYSREDGTPAAEMDGQIEEELKLRRQEIVMEEQSRINDELNQKMVGGAVKVLIEGFDRYAECYFGRSEADAPDIDGKIFVQSKQKLEPGTFQMVRISGVMDFDLLGEVVSESNQ